MRKGLGNEHRTAIHNCPYCGKVNELASGVNHDHAPTPGSITLCIGCGEISLFDEELNARKPTVAEMLDIQRSGSWPTVQRAAAAIREIHHRMGRPQS